MAPQACGSRVAKKILRRGRAASRRTRDLVIHTGIEWTRRIPAHWYRGTPNFGDQLSPAVLAWITGSAPIWVTRSYRGKTLAVGSIMSALAEHDVVWGAGSIRDETIVPPRDVHFLAVRGPLTRERIAGDVPAIYGDPALLLPLFHDPPIARRYTTGIVPHYVDLEAIRIDDPTIAVIDVRDPWQQVVSLIRSCDVILSSSLHGLIIAEAYGIPASWIKITDGVVGDGFKFNDYYLSTGRDEMRPTSWEKGIAAAIANPAPPLIYDPQPLLDAARNLPGSDNG
jgi:pyruvyltransferase